MSIQWIDPQMLGIDRDSGDKVANVAFGIGSSADIPFEGVSPDEFRSRYLDLLAQRAAYAQRMAVTYDLVSDAGNDRIEVVGEEKPLLPETRVIRSQVGGKSCFVKASTESSAWWSVWGFAVDVAGIASRAPLDRRVTEYAVPGERPVECRYVVPERNYAKEDLLIPASTAFHWIAKDLQERLSPSAPSRSTEIEPHRLSRHGIRQFWALWRGMTSGDRSRVFVTDSTGITVTSHNGAHERVSEKGPSKNRSETWCPALDRFESESAYLFVDRTVQHELEPIVRTVKKEKKVVGYNVRPVPHGLPWDVFSDWDYTEIRSRARSMAFQRDVRNSRKIAENVWEDVAQDASIRFAALLQESESWEVAYRSDEGWPVAYWFTPKSASMAEVDLFEADDEVFAFDEASESFVPVETDTPVKAGFMVTRSTLHSWSVKAALKRYGLDRLGGTTALEGESLENLAEGQQWEQRPSSRPMHLNTSYTLSVAANPMDEHIWRMVWQNGANAPILSQIVQKAASDPNATKAAFWKEAAQATINRDKVTAKDINVTKGAGSDEWAELQRNLHEARQTWAVAYDPAE